MTYAEEIALKMIAFFPKMAHLLALYRDPPSNLYFFDECPGIQILKRLAPDLQTNEMNEDAA